MNDDTFQAGLEAAAKLHEQYADLCEKRADFCKERGELEEAEERSRSCFTHRTYADQIRGLQA